MYKFTKIPDKDNPFDINTIELSMSTGLLEDLLQSFEYFLKASGFIFTGNVRILESDNEL